MGEIADMILDGTLCQICGAFMEDLTPDKGRQIKEPPGYPRTCDGCYPEDE